MSFVINKIVIINGYSFNALVLIIVSGPSRTADQSLAAAQVILYL
ncbi:MAG: hypothetical protein ACI8Y3_000581 [Paraglaciecola sp.]|jgi:hypothetical protein